MIYLSAQPDHYYYLWQLELQIYNYRSLGIQPGNIHILVAFDMEKGLNPLFVSFINNCRDAQFYTYPDNRLTRKYPSSIRPHIIARHLHRFSELQQETIFYHDSDIIFRSLPQWEPLLSDETWYVSDAQNYIGVNYIKEQIGQESFEGMCNIVGISPECVEQNNNGGGAQYLLKKVSATFWEKVEKDCENLYPYLQEKCGENRFPREMKKESIQLQSFCTDMWVVWWNALLEGREFKIEKSLDFCWANQPIEQWYKTSILHYTGSAFIKQEKFFSKFSYTDYSPFYDDLSDLPQDTCSYPLINLITEYRSVLEEERVDLKDLTFLVPLHFLPVGTVQAWKIVIDYITRFFKTSVKVIEVGTERNLYLHSQPPEVDYHFLSGKEEEITLSETINHLTRITSSPYLCIWEQPVIPLFSGIIQAAEQLRSGKADLIFPHNGQKVGIDILTKHVFYRILDSDLLDQNRGKTILLEEEFDGGVCLMNREAYLNAGMENNHIIHPALNSKERVMRMRVLGNSVAYTDGMLFSLENNKRKKEDNLQYSSSLKEYQAISTMTTSTLKQYIMKW